jgi:hypothetical protein
MDSGKQPGASSRTCKLDSWGASGSGVILTLLQCAMHKPSAAEAGYLLGHRCGTTGSRNLPGSLSACNRKRVLRRWPRDPHPARPLYAWGRGNAMGTRVEAAGTKGPGILPSLGDLVAPFYPLPGTSVPSTGSVRPTEVQRSFSRAKNALLQDDNQTG